MHDFPEFMKNPLNKIDPGSQFYQGDLRLMIF